MIDIGKNKVDINCPKCKRAIKVSIEQVAKNATVTCTCGVNINLTDKNGSAKKTINDINKSFKSLEDTLHHFN